MLRTLLAVFALLVPALLPVRAAEEGRPPINVVLFVTDDQGQDAGCYGNPVIK